MGGDWAGFLLGGHIWLGPSGTTGDGSLFLLVNRRLGPGRFGVLGRRSWFWPGWLRRGRGRFRETGCRSRSLTGRLRLVGWLGGSTGGRMQIGGGGRDLLLGRVRLAGGGDLGLVSDRWW